MKSRLCIIFMLLVLFKPILSNNYKDKLKLNIELEKNEYQPYESIFGDLKLKNVSDEKINIRSLFTLLAEHLCFMTCLGNNKTEYTGYPGSVGWIHNPTFNIDIEPNDSLLITFNLLNCMGERDSCDIHRFYLPEDSYQIYATFYPDAHNWTPKSQHIKSDQINFVVLKKTSQIYQTNDFEFLANSLMIRDQSKDYEQFREDMITFIKKFPESFYLDNAFRKLHLVQRINIQDNIHFYKWLKKSYEKYYNHYFFGEWIINWIPVEERLHLSNNKDLVSELYYDFTKRFKASKGMRYLKYKEYYYRKLKTSK